MERGPIPTHKRDPKNAKGRSIMSAFDDEFGLFGEDADEAERRPTLGARKIGGANETIIDDIELEEPRRSAPTADRAPRSDAQPRFEGTPAGAGAPRNDRRRRDDRPSYADRPQHRRNADPQDPWAGHRRATVILDFLAKNWSPNPRRSRSSCSQTKRNSR